MRDTIKHCLFLIDFMGKFTISDNKLQHYTITTEVKIRINFQSSMSESELF